MAKKETQKQQITRLTIERDALLKEVAALRKQIDEPKPPIVEVKTVEVIPNPLNLEVGSSSQITAIAKAENDKIVQVKFAYESEDNRIATVSGTGKVVGISKGEIVIVVYAPNKVHGVAKVFVKKSEVEEPPMFEVATVEIEPPSLNLEVGASSMITAIAKDEKGNIVRSSFTYESKDTNIAQVSAAGKVSGTGKGITSISATASNKVQGFATVEVSEKEPPPPIDVDEFDPVRILNEWTGAGVETVSGANGDNLGRLIQEADARLGSGFGKINLVEGGTYKTPATTSERRLFEFYEGLFKSDTGLNNHYGRIHYPKDRTVFYSKNWDAIIEEFNDFDAVGVGARGLIQPFAQTIVPYDLGESTANILKSENIHVIGCHFRGVKANNITDSPSSVSFGNGDNCSIQNSWLEDISSYGVQFGGTGGNYVVGKTLPDGRTVGYYAKNGLIRDNLFTGLLTQNLALITFDGLVVERNKFINPGRPSLKIIDFTDKGKITVSERHWAYTGGFVYFENVTGLGDINVKLFSTVKLSPTEFQIVNLDGSSFKANGSWAGGGIVWVQNAFSTIADIEPVGSDREIVRGLKYRNNLIDCAMSGGGLYGGLAYQITANQDNGGAEITDNQMLGTATGSNFNFGIKVNSSRSDDVLVARNYVKCAAGVGLEISGNNIRAIDNQLESSGGGGNACLQAADLTNSFVKRNNLYRVEGNPVYGSTAVEERGVNKNNRWENNTAYHILHTQGAVVTDSKYLSNTLEAGVIQNENSVRNLID